MNSAIAEIPVCSCDLNMHETKPGSEFYFCLNCDRPQPQQGEIKGLDTNGLPIYFERNETMQDKIFDKRFAAKIKQWYPKQGPANPAP